jgi:hypothetical protein
VQILLSEEAVLPRIGEDGGVGRIGYPDVCPMDVIDTCVAEPTNPAKREVPVGETLR